jgi:hypothetical protein
MAIVALLSSLFIMEEYMQIQTNGANGTNEKPNGGKTEGGAANPAAPAAGAEQNTNVQAATVGKKPRRSPEDARAARLKREEALAEKHKKRAERLAREAAEAAEKAKIVLERKEKIASSTNTRPRRADAPTIPAGTVTKIMKDVKKMFKDLSAQYGIAFEDPVPRLTRQGQSLSVRVTAQAAAAANGVKKVVGATREATRFLQFAKVVGIKPTLLNKEVQLAGEAGNFKVLGLKGRTHDVVLQKVGSEGEEAQPRIIPADEFKTKMVAA